MSIQHTLAANLQQRKEDHRFRQRRVMHSGNGVEAVVDGKSCICFCSNDYLGLANHPEVVSSYVQAAQEFGVGSGASHLVCGHSYHHHALEEELAEFVGSPKALLFSTGYMANLGVINALTQRGDAVFEDKLNHASLIDGGILAKAEMLRYRHNDCDHLRSRLEASQANAKLIVTDGVFSMDGDIAPLPELADLASQYQAWLMVDDAHGFGCLGGNGGGCAEYFGLGVEQLPVLVGTLGKSFGTFGAFVAGSEDLIESLIQFCRSYIYTTALPPAVAAATRTSLRLLRDERSRREHLQVLIAQFQKGCQALGLDLLPSETPIQPILMGAEEKAVKASSMLEEDGFWVTPIRPPTVPEGASRLRVTFSAEHTSKQVDMLLSALEKVAKEIKP